MPCSEFPGEPRRSSFWASELDVKDVSVLVDWRILDNSLFYVGPLVTLGYPTGELRLEEVGELETADIDADQISYGIAAEGGIRVSRLLVGAELGYRSVKLESPGFLELTPTIDMSGFFGRILLGVAVF